MNKKSIFFLCVVTCSLFYQTLTIQAMFNKKYIGPHNTPINKHVDKVLYPTFYGNTGQGAKRSDPLSKYISPLTIDSTSFKTPTQNLPSEFIKNNKKGNGLVLISGSLNYSGIIDTDKPKELSKLSFYSKIINTSNGEQKAYLTQKSKYITKPKEEPVQSPIRQRIYDLENIEEGNTDGLNILRALLEELQMIDRIRSERLQQID